MKIQLHELYLSSFTLKFPHKATIEMLNPSLLDYGLVQLHSHSLAHPLHIKCRQDMRHGKRHLISQQFVSLDGVWNICPYFHGEWKNQAIL